MHPREQTIFALASGRPPTAIAIVRVSGPCAPEALRAIAGGLPRPRVATLARLRDPSGAAIDDAVVLWFPAPASATGEDVAEFHIHGGRAVQAALFAALAQLDDVRTAAPGEFTQRAFENGKIDLTEAEGLDDLIHADTDRQRRQALRQLHGLLGDKARRWRQQIIEAAALIEAGIDFADEDDVPDDLMAPALSRVAALRDEIEATLGASKRSERLRDGLVVAIAGAPNVGKSTLLNALARREVAIVSPHAGTTRDLIEVQLDLDGYPVTLIDTAGIRDTDDPVEQEGVRRARARAAEADLVLWLVDGGEEARPEIDAGAGADAPVWILRNKIDLASRDSACDSVAAERRRNSGMLDGEDGRPLTDGSAGRPRLFLSAASGQGMSELTAAMAGFAGDYFGAGEGVAIARQRHRDLLWATSEMLRRSIDAAGAGEEIVAEELRLAARELGRLLGRVDIEEVFDVIFREFCIGK